MAQRGRKSAASKGVAALGGVVSETRPDAPYSLTDEQALVWREVIDDLPADWFRRSNHELLEQYARHVVAARHVAMLIENRERAEGDLDIAEYDKLLKLQERESRAIMALATKMRLSQQAIYDARATKPAQSAKKPWQKA